MKKKTLEQVKRILKAGDNAYINAKGIKVCNSTIVETGTHIGSSTVVLRKETLQQDVIDYYRPLSTPVAAYLEPQERDIEYVDTRFCCDGVEIFASDCNRLLGIDYGLYVALGLPMAVKSDATKTGRVMLPDGTCLGRKLLPQEEIARFRRTLSLVESI
jgi:hypothetical protein